MVRRDTDNIDEAASLVTGVKAAVAMLLSILKIKYRKIFSRFSKCPGWVVDWPDRCQMFLLLLAKHSGSSWD